MIKECKKCGSKNLYLEPRIKGQDILSADMVALKCKDCGSWIKWCPKDERQFYINKNQDNKVEECWVIKQDDYDVFWGEYGWTTKLRNAFFREKEEYCLTEIDICSLQNCRPVKVELRVVGE